MDMPQKLAEISGLSSSNKHDDTSLTGDCSMEASLAGRVSISVADVGETAVVVSLVERNQSEELSVSALHGKDTENTFISASLADMPKLEAPSSSSACTVPNFGGQELELYLNTDDEEIRRPRCLMNKFSDSGLDCNFGLSVGTSTAGNCVHEVLLI